MRWKGVLSFAVCALATFCLYIAQGKSKEIESKPQTKLEKYLGAEVMALLSSPKTIEVFRVDEETRQTWAQGKPKLLDKTAAKKLSTILSDETQYEWDNGKARVSRCLDGSVATRRAGNHEESLPR